MAEEKEVVEGEVVSNEEKKEKKESKIGGFFKKAKGKFDDATFEMRLKNEFTKEHKNYTVNTGAGLLNRNFDDLYVEEHLDEGFILAFGEVDVDLTGILYDTEAEKGYYIDKVEKATISCHFEDADYERPATKIYFSQEAKKVSVIKAGNSYFLTKEEANK